LTSIYRKFIRAILQITFLTSSTGYKEGGVGRVLFGSIGATDYWWIVVVVWMPWD
jgi:hypothetical protein